MNILTGFLKRKPPAPALKGYVATRSGDALLDVDPRPNLLRQIRHLAGVSDRLWDGLYRPVLLRVADTQQSMPASQFHHHSYAGGLLDHTLETTTIALRLRNEQENPFGAGSHDDLVLQREIYTYTVFICAICHDIGKVLVDQKLMLITDTGASKPWQPFEGPVADIASHYCFSFDDSRQHRLHEPAGLFLLAQYVPADGLNWLVGYPDLLAWTLGAFTGHKNPISNMVHRADSLSVSRNMGRTSDTRKSVQGRAPFQLPVIIREMIDEGHITLNKAGAIGFHANGGLYVQTRRFTELLQTRFREGNLSGLPTDTSRLFDMLAEYGLALRRPDGLVVRKVLFRSDEWVNETPLPMIKLDLSALLSDDEPVPPLWTGDAIEQGVEPPESGVRTEPTADTDTDNALITATEDAPPERPRIKAGPAIKTETVRKTPPKPSSVKDTPDKTEPSVNEAGQGTQPVAQQFIEWLSTGLACADLKSNTKDSPVHVTDLGIALVTPRIFDLFDEVAGLGRATIQREVSRARVSIKNDTNGFLFTFSIKGKRSDSKLNCWILNEETGAKIRKIINKKPNANLRYQRKPSN